MNSKCLLLAVFCFLAFVPISAAGDAQIAADAAPIVLALENHYREAKTLKAIFLERYSDGRNGFEAESGTVYFSRPGRMRWEYESPETKLFISDGKSVWFYVPPDRSVTHAPMKQSSDWRTPLALLTGKAQLSRLCDKVELTKQLPGTLGNVVLVCLPRGELHHPAPGQKQADSEDALNDTGAAFDKVFLEVNPVTGQLGDVRILQPGGIELEYRFGNWEENVPIAESEFHFQVPPGVAIVNGPSTSPSTP